jgi:hypothetical protein
MNPLIRECDTLVIEGLRSIKVMIATSIANPSQYAAEFGNDADSLQTKLQHETARKTITHRTVESRSMDRNEVRVKPARLKQTSPSNNKSEARLKPVPMLGSSPNIRTDTNTIQSRNER